MVNISRRLLGHISRVSESRYDLSGYLKKAIYHKNHLSNLRWSDIYSYLNDLIYHIELAIDVSDDLSVEDLRNISKSVAEILTNFESYSKEYDYLANLIYQYERDGGGRHSGFNPSNKIDDLLAKYDYIGEMVSDLDSIIDTAIQR